ncbi:TetR/AcrR family transcriptional regulator [Pseudomonas rustica]|jgi:AcrR family transcriptional regulator|uniref:TetR/AcrR family transcriptional regulator n=1 Tax=Pseudomonas rustica TaxID=2827099 RepID=UPI0020162801|nr:TetR/AcrR family transcriptional regulator [Pseudomonas rustica]
MNEVTTPSPRSPKRAKTPAPTPETGAECPAETPEVRKPRINEKARLRTRNKLLRAARTVMGSKGIEATTINDITDEAELSFGSFYNYFPSKEEVARAVFIEDAQLMVEEFEAADTATTGIAEIVGTNFRLTICRGLSDPVWGWFLVYSIYSINDMLAIMGKPLARDIRIGNDSKDFEVVDVDATVDCIIGGMLFLLRQILQGARPVSAIGSAVQYILRGLGVSPDEAERIVNIELGNAP